MVFLLRQVHCDDKLKGGSRKAIALFINYDFNTSCQMTLKEIYVQMRLSGKSYNSSIYNWNNETSATYIFSMEWRPIQLNQWEYSMQDAVLQHRLCASKARGRISSSRLEPMQQHSQKWAIWE